jgi:hypothetical protein
MVWCRCRLAQSLTPATGTAAMPPTDLPAYFTDVLVIAGLVLTAARFVWRRRDALFRRGRSTVPAVQSDGEEIMLFIWTGVILVLITFLFQLPSM